MMNGKKISDPGSTELFKYTESESNINGKYGKGTKIHMQCRV